MIYRLLADLVTVVHFGFVIFVVLGAVLVWRWPRLVWLHIPAAIWGAWIEFSGRLCPLTPLEVQLRQAGGEAGYQGGFVEQYLLPILYPANLTSDIQLWLGTAVLVINGVAYGLLTFRWWRGRQQPD